MSQYKLVYFNGRGRAELVRWVFKVAGVEFEDYRFPKGGWAPFKPTTNFGQVPVLIVDDKTQYCQSTAIARYIAQKYGLAGNSIKDETRCDMIVDGCMDVALLTTVIFREHDEGKKAELKKKFEDEQLPKFLTLFEGVLKHNGGGDGWFVADKMTWADLAFVLCTGSWLDAIHVETDFTAYPKIEALRQKVMAHPAVADWNTNGPKTAF